MLIIIFISIYFRNGIKSLPITLNAEKTKEQTINNPNEALDENTYNVSEEYIDQIDAQIEDIPLEEIESILSETDYIPQSIDTYDEAIISKSNDGQNAQIIESEEEYDSDLIDEILKEIEMEKKDKWLNSFISLLFLKKKL